MFKGINVIPFLIIDPVCRTVASPMLPNHQNRNQKCIFPFTYNETSYEKCIKTNVGNDYWCKTANPTKDSSPNTDADWGICNDKCETLKGNENLMNANSISS